MGNGHSDVLAISSIKDSEKAQDTKEGPNLRRQLELSMSVFSLQVSHTDSLSVAGCLCQMIGKHLNEHLQCNACNMREEVRLMP